MRDTSTRVAALLAENPLLLAPMAGVCDVTFRSLCKELGAGLTFTEMVSAKGLSYGNEKTTRLLALAENEPQVVVQLFGSDPALIAAEGHVLEDMLGERLALIDINMGCPVRKVVKKGEGSALMRDPERAAAIIRALVAAVDVPVSVKFRKGFSEDEDTCVGFGRILQDAGASLVTVHGRTAAQYYSGVADWDAIERVAQALVIPVVGNGDLTTPDAAVRALHTYAVAAVMLARGARDDPFIFRGAQRLLRGEPAGSPATLLEKIELARRHARGLAARTASGGPSLVRMRKHVAWYMNGVPYATQIRRRAMECSNLADFEELFDAVELWARSPAGRESLRTCAGV